LIGAVIAGPVADRIGRKTVLVAATLEFALGALATTQATSLQFLLVVRLITGLGIGAALPNSVALCSEYSPVSRRSTLLVLVLCGITLGSMAAGLIAAHVMPAYGWQSIFWVGGITPLALTPLLVAGLAESPYLLAVRARQTHGPGDRDAEIARSLTRINAAAAGLLVGARFVLREERGALREERGALREERGAGLSATHLFRGGRAVATILLWITVFMNSFEIYVFASWLPTVARASGMTEQASVWTGVAMTVGGFLGTLAMGWLLERFSIERMMAVNYAAAAGFIALLALVAGDRWSMTFVSIAAGFCIVGGQTGANALIAYRHPTYIRATALAWALGAARIASIIGPLLAGWIISLGWSSRSTFLVAVIPALCASGTVLVLGERVWKHYRATTGDPSRHCP
jgi:MFS transporter, AAHS family, 4-hydroxybenzoate transporter